MTGSPVKSEDLTPSIYEYVFQNYRSEWVLLVRSVEEGKLILEKIDAYNQGIVVSPVNTDLRIVARAISSVSFKKMFNIAEFDPGKMRGGTLFVF